MPALHPLSRAFAVVLGFALVNPLRAQEKQNCVRYQESAVRVEPGGMFSGRKLVRLNSGVEVMKIRAGTARIEEYFARSDSAVSYAVDFGRHQLRSNILMAAAFGTSFLLPMVVDMNGDDKRELRWGSWALSFGLGLWGQAQQRSADRSLARAVWHYNSTIHDAAVLSCSVGDSTKSRSKE